MEVGKYYFWEKFCFQIVYLSGFLNISFLNYNEAGDSVHSGEGDIFQSKNSDNNPQRKP